MKGSFIFAVVALVGIIVAASFGLGLELTPAKVIPDAFSGKELYVCHAATNTWDSIAMSMRQFSRYIIMFYFFVVIIIMFNWGWVMYQNLLQDKFKRESFTNVWKFTKFAFWTGIILLILMATPNHFRTVHIRGVSGDWVLCEANSPDAAAVRADAVTM